MKIKIGRVEKRDGGASAVVEFVANGDNLPVWYGALVKWYEALVKGFKGVTGVKVNFVTVSIIVRLDPSLWNEEPEFLKEYFTQQFEKY